MNSEFEHFIFSYPLTEASVKDPMTGMNGNEPKPGDLIEIFRNVYEHWAVYVGQGFVVHLLGPDGTLSSSNINLPIGKNNVLKQKLLEVVSTDCWTINNLLDHEKRPRPAEVIVSEANKLVGTTRPYNVLDYNCEHFATELRYGNAESQQVGPTTGETKAGYWRKIEFGLLEIRVSLRN
ncbi:phospholipase A and acyltransferase 4-like isoform X2 [Cyprinodon tularosa]|uniref:phospholipase A and acyltransferase 4-like isoform X2 n=1 Tax=Cyprinodon tularosa TaxID=77115 RepID=UPI0018E2681F|nr:phospholipase A and acyltransferase 4-like isoform X2 [Cyprinodon tularosa]